MNHERGVMEELRRTGEQLLPVVAYGDAKGLPVETRSYKFIQEKYGYLDRLVPVVDNAYCLQDFPAGTTSDDEQLSRAVMKALMRSDRFDLDIIADEHVTAFNETPKDVTPSGRELTRFWGGSTTGSIKNIISGMSPRESGSKDGMGNGVLMKMAPLVLQQVAKAQEGKARYYEYDLLTNMTHDNDIARISTRVHGDVLTHLLTRHYHPWTFVDDVIEMAEYHERWFRSTWDVSNTLLGLRDIARGRRITETVQEWCDRWGEGAKNEREFGKSYGFYAPQTLALSYAAFIAGTYGSERRPDFKETVDFAVNIGGDADSCAGIAGTMYNFAWKGDFDLPDEIENVQNIDKIRELSGKFGNHILEIYTSGSAW